MTREKRKVFLVGYLKARLTRQNDYLRWIMDLREIRSDYPSILQHEMASDDRILYEKTVGNG